MSIGAQSPQVAQAAAAANAQNTAPATTPGQSQGSRRGEAVAALNHNQIQEEIGNLVSSHADKKTLGQLKIRQGAEAIDEAWERYLSCLDSLRSVVGDKLPNMPRNMALLNLFNQLSEFHKQLDASGEVNVSADDVLEALQDFDSDVTHQYAALQALRSLFDRADSRGSMSDLLDAVERVYDPGIRRNFQEISAAAKAARSVEASSASQRESVRDLSREGKSVPQVYDGLLRIYPNYVKDESFNNVVSVFLEAAGREISNAPSQADKLIIGGLIRELGVLKNLRTIFLGVVKALENTRSIDPEFCPDAKKDECANRLMKIFVDFIDKGSPSQKDARKFLEWRKSLGSRTEVILVNAIIDLHRDLSDRVYPSVSARLAQLKELIRLCIDRSAREEEEHAAQSSLTGVQ